MRAIALGLTRSAAILIWLGADVCAKDKIGKGAFDHTKKIKDEEKRAAMLALMSEYSVLCAVATGQADLVAAAVAKGCNVNETDQAGNTAAVLKAGVAKMPEFSDQVLALSSPPHAHLFLRQGQCLTVSE